MKNYQIINYNSFNKNEYSDRFLILNCLRVCNEANAKSDYLDIKERLFGKDDLIKEFIIDEKGDIYGFLIGEIFKGYNYNNILHIHNIVISPLLEDEYVIDLIKILIKEYDPDVITSKTHNPKIFEVFTNLPYLITYYPNIYRAIPTDVYNLLLNNPYLQDANNKLICKNAYPSINLQKNSYKSEVNSLFININDYDALVIVSILHDHKLDLRCKCFIKK